MTNPAISAFSLRYLHVCENGMKAENKKTEQKAPSVCPSLCLKLKIKQVTEEPNRNRLSEHSSSIFSTGKRHATGKYREKQTGIVGVDCDLCTIT
jgi:hypothetical protein